MTRLLENHSLDQLAARGVPVARGQAVSSPAEAESAAAELGGRAVLKALAPVGGRGKAGAIIFARDPADAGRAAEQLLGGCFRNFPVEAVLASEWLEIGREFFLSFTFDALARTPLLLFSTEGGVEIETLAAERPELVQRRQVDITTGLREFEAREVVSRAGLRGNTLLKVAQAMVGAYRTFRECDAALLEINPLVETADGRILAASAVLTLDDQAVFRHPELQHLPGQIENNGWRPLTELERAMKAIDRTDPSTGPIRFNEFEAGDLGFMVTGGGAGLLTLDTVYRLGALPATTFDIKIGEIEEKMYLATKAVLRRPGLRGLISAANFANFASIDVKVRGVVRALKELEIDCRRFPVVMRLCGPNQDEARRLAAEVPGLEYYDDTTTLEEAVERIVELVEGKAAREHSD